MTQQLKDIVFLYKSDESEYEVDEITTKRLYIYS